MTPEKLVLLLRQRRQQMQVDVFASPPTNYEEFQNRLGRYQENETLEAILSSLIKGDADEDIQSNIPGRQPRGGVRK